MNTKNLSLLSIITFIILLALSAYAWVELPADAQVPIHWNFAGEVDRYASKQFGLVLMPITVAILSLMFKYLPKLEPRKENLEQSTALYSALWLMVLTLISLAQLTIISISLGFAFPFTSAITLVTSLTFILVGNYLGKSKSMFLMGVRTPWTLSSEESWGKTNRLFGKLLMLIGIVTIVLLSTSDEPNFSLKFLLLSLLPASLSVITYSYFIWKKEQSSE